jgi:hypothetical protein
MPRLTDRERLRANAMALADDLGIDPEAFAEDIDEIMQDILYYIRSGQGDALDAVQHVARQRGVTV